MFPDVPWARFSRLYGTRLINLILPGTAMPGYRLYRPFGTASQHRPSSVFRKSDHTIILKLKQISSYLLGNLLDRVLALVTEAAGKSNRHINRAYVAADHLCGMR